MAEPKQRQTHSSGKIRRAYHRQKKQNLALCLKCKQPTLPHQVCKVCGTYKSQQIIKTKTLVKTSTKSKKEK